MLSSASKSTVDVEVVLKRSGFRLVNVRPAAVDCRFKSLATVRRCPGSQLATDAIPDALRARSLFDRPVLPQELITVNDGIGNLDGVRQMLDGESVFLFLR